MSSGKNEAEVYHAVLCDVVSSKGKLIVSFMSGEGKIIDMNGDLSDPLLFTMEIHPRDQEAMDRLLNLLGEWIELSHPIDVVMSNGDVRLHNTHLDRIVNINAC